LISLKIQKLIDLARKKNGESIIELDQDEMMASDLESEDESDKISALETRAQKITKAAHDEIVQEDSKILGGWSKCPEWIESPIGCLSGMKTIPDLSLDRCFDDMVWLNENDLLSIPIINQTKQKVSCTEPKTNENIHIELF
jgi:hypothetical protein